MVFTTQYIFVTCFHVFIITIEKVCEFIKNDRHKEYFKMYCQGYSIEEISNKYGVKYNGTKTILSRIRKRLREHEKEIRELI